MDFNLEKAIAEYTKEAFQMASRSIKEDTGLIIVPEPEPIPEPILQPISVPETEPDILFDDIAEEESGNEDVEDEPPVVLEEVRDGSTVPQEKGEESKPSFEDYISRRNRSWERGTNPKTSKAPNPEAQESKIQEPETQESETQGSEIPMPEIPERNQESPET